MEKQQLKIKSVNIYHVARDWLLVVTSVAHSSNKPHTVNISR